MLNVTKFEYYYFKNETGIDILKFNHIHISMGLDDKYCDLALVSIAIILNTSSSDTYSFSYFGIKFRIQGN